MKKAEYIEKYGEEAWSNRLNKMKLKRNKAYLIAEKGEEWYEEHILKPGRKNAKNQREKNPDYNKKWKEENKEHVSEYNKEYLKGWREDNPEYMDNWRAENSEHVETYTIQYRNDNKDRINTYNKEYRKTPNGKARNIISAYKQVDTEKGYDISNIVTAEWIVENIFSGQKCVYCGDSDWTHLGCDRIDNSKGHTPENCIPSCFICNADRADRFTVEEFKVYRSLHPRACDIPKGPAIELSEFGALKKRTIV